MLFNTILPLTALAASVLAERQGNIDLNIGTDDFSQPKRVRAQAAYGRQLQSQGKNGLKQTGSNSAVLNGVLTLLDAGWNGRGSVESVIASAKAVLTLQKRAESSTDGKELVVEKRRPRERKDTVKEPEIELHARGRRATTTTTRGPRPRTTTTTTTTPRPQVATSTTTTTTSTTTSVTCATPYRPAVAVPTITGPGTLPKPTTFVTKSRTSQQLMLNGAPFRMVGPNIYWLCNDENIPGVPKGTPTEKGRVREALAIAVAMGANTIRLTSCGTSVGYPQAVEPNLGVWGTAAYQDIHDYVIYAAGVYGLRIVMPLTDNYQYYHGGKYTFLNWVNAPTTNFGNAFFTNTAAYNSFRDYITYVMTRVNPYNGIAYGRDPTIAVWETGNEFGAYGGKEGYPPLAFTNQVARLIKTYSSALVMDGSDGFYNYTNGAVAPGVNSSYVDMMTDHAYPRNVNLLKTEQGIASRYGKNFNVGEFDWTNSFGGDSLSTYLSYVASQPAMGLMMWNVFGHDSQCCAYVPHNDGYSAYYPNGNSIADQANLLQLTQFNYRVTGRTVPNALPAVACPQPVF